MENGFLRFSDMLVGPLQQLPLQQECCCKQATSTQQRSRQGMWYAAKAASVHVQRCLLRCWLLVACVLESVLLQRLQQLRCEATDQVCICFLLLFSDCAQHSTLCQ